VRAELWSTAERAAAYLPLTDHAHMMAVSRAPAGVVVAAAAARAAKLSYGLMGPPGLSDVRPLVAAWWDREAARPTGQQPFSSDRTIAWRSPRATQHPPWHRHRPPGMEEGKLTGGSTSMFKKLKSPRFGFALVAFLPLPFELSSSARLIGAAEPRSAHASTTTSPATREEDEDPSIYRAEDEVRTPVRFWGIWGRIREVSLASLAIRAPA
jgi:hypothetical protein